MQRVIGSERDFLFCSRRLELAGHLKQWHLKVIEIVKRGQHRKSLDKLFQGFKPAVESCYFNWEAAYPLEGITYCSADKKSSTFCWSRAVQLQRGARAAAGGMGDGSDSGAAPRAEGFAGDYKGRGSAYSSQQEVAVRPKETKRKALSMGSGGGVLVRLGGSVSLTLEDAGAKCIYKGPSPSFGGKMKLPQGGAKGSSVGGPGGSGALAAGKHGSAKRRTSSEDSSLEPDLAELSLDDGSSLALGAEASNTFEFLPPAPDMLPSLSPLLRDSHKQGCNGGGSKMFETKCEGHSSASQSHPPSFLSKESAGAGMDGLLAAEKEAALEVVPAGNRDEDVDSTSTSTARSSTTEKLAKPVQNYGQVPSDTRSEGGPASRRPGAVEGAVEGAAEGAAEGSAEEGGEEPVEEDVVGEDDYQAYYVGVASEEGMDRQLADNLHQEEEPDIFAGIKPLEQENRMEVRTGFSSNFQLGLCWWKAVKMSSSARLLCF